jgi:hypothetical protein
MRCTACWTQQTCASGFTLIEGHTVDELIPIDPSFPPVGHGTHQDASQAAVSTAPTAQHPRAGTPTAWPPTAAQPRPGVPRRRDQGWRLLRRGLHRRGHPRRWLPGQSPNRDPLTLSRQTERRSSTKLPSGLCEGLVDLFPEASSSSNGNAAWRGLQIYGRRLRWGRWTRGEEERWVKLCREDCCVLSFLRRSQDHVFLRGWIVLYFKMY